MFKITDIGSVETKLGKVTSFLGVRVLSAVPNSRSL